MKRCTRKNYAKLKNLTQHTALRHYDVMIRTVEVGVG